MRWECASFAATLLLISCDYLGESKAEGTTFEIPAGLSRGLAATTANGTPARSKVTIGENGIVFEERPFFPLKRLSRLKNGKTSSLNPGLTKDGGELTECGCFVYWAFDLQSKDMTGIDELVSRAKIEFDEEHRRRGTCEVNSSVGDCPRLGLAPEAEEILADPLSHVRGKKN